MTPQKTRENQEKTYSTVQEHFSSLRRGLKVIKEAETHCLQQEVKVDRFRRGFIIHNFIIVAIKLRSNTLSFLNSTQLVLSYSSTKTENLQVKTL